jgi:hypothetical protein
MDFRFYYKNLDFLNDFHCINVHLFIITCSRTDLQSPNYTKNIIQITVQFAVLHVINDI